MDEPIENETINSTIAYCVTVGAFRSRSEAEDCAAKLKAAGFDGIVQQCELPGKVVEDPRDNIIPLK